MSNLTKLVKESIKTRNLIRRHNKNHQIPGFYEQCQKIKKILEDDRSLKNEFTVKDISHFFIGYHMLSKSIFKMNEKELEESLKEYFYCKSRTQYYYFRVGLDYRVAKNSKIGNGTIIHFSSLPTKIKKRLEDNYSHEHNRDHFANQSPENYKKLRSDDYYMKIKIKSKGTDNATQKAINSFHFNKSIFEFFTLTNFHEELDTSAVYISIDEHDNVGIQSFGSVSEKQMYQKQFLVKFIQKINQVLDKEENKRNDIEKQILLAVNIVGTHDSNSNVAVRFLFVFVAIEILLVGSSSRSVITSRLIDRMVFLLGDDEDWINYYKMVYLQKQRTNRKITKKFVARHLKKARMKLASIMYEAYGKRSNIAHYNESNISEQDYYLMKLLLVKLVIKMFELLDKGLQCIEKNNNCPENKSLSHFINQLKFG